MACDTFFSNQKTYLSWEVTKDLSLIILAMYMYHQVLQITSLPENENLN